MAFGTLKIYHPDGKQEQVKLTKPTVRVGRADDNDVVLNDESVSSNHAQLLCDTDDCQILDLGSANGTYLTGVRLTPHALQPVQDGAMLQIGRVALTYHASAQEREVGAAPSSDTSSTMRLPVGVTPPLPPGVPTGTPSPPASSSATPAEREQDKTMLIATVRPTSQHVPAVTDDSTDKTQRMPVVQQPASQRSTVPPPKSLESPPPRRGWGQPPSPISAPGARSGSARSRWLLAIGTIVVLAVLAGGVWLLLPSMFESFSSNATPPPSDNDGGSAPSTGGSAPGTGRIETSTERPARAPFASPSPAPDEQGGLYVVAAGPRGLRVRSGPGLSAPLVGLLEDGTVVRVVEGPVAADGYTWVSIQAEDLNGWCAREFLRPR